MKLINASRVYDGQSAFKNGIHDAIRVPQEPCLYRTGWANQVLWHIGRAIGSLPGMRFVTITAPHKRNVGERVE